MFKRTLTTPEPLSQTTAESSPSSAMLPCDKAGLQNAMTKSRNARTRQQPNKHKHLPEEKYCMEKKVGRGNCRTDKRSQCPGILATQDLLPLRSKQPDASTARRQTPSQKPAQAVILTTLSGRAKRTLKRTLHEVLQTKLDHANTAQPERSTNQWADKLSTAFHLRNLPWCAQSMLDVSLDCVRKCLQLLLPEIRRVRGNRQV